MDKDYNVSLWTNKKKRFRTESIIDMKEKLERLDL